MKRTALTVGTIAVVTLSSTIFIGNTSVYAQKTLDEVKQEQDDVKAKLSNAESKIADVLYEIKEINEEVKEFESELEDNDKQIKEIESTIEEYETEIDNINQRIEERNDILKDRISSFQENGGNVSYLEVLLGSRDFMELVSRVSAVTTITNADAELLEKQEEDKEVVEIKLGEQDDLQNDLKETQQIIQEKIEKQEQANKDLKQKESELKEKKENLETENSDLEALENEVRADMDTYTPEPTTVANASSEEEKPKSPSNPTSKPNANGGSAIDAGMSMLGTPYKSAGKGPGGFDCSGFVSWAYGEAGKSVPSYTGALRNTGSKVSTSDMQPGDLVFFNTIGTDSHVGIYVGGGNFIASNTTNGVEVKSLNDHYWKDTFKGHVRRVN